MRRVGLLGAVRLFAAMLIISLMSGCAHRSEAGRAIAYATQAAEKGDGKGLQIQVDYIITMPGKARNLTKLFKNNPEAASLYLIAAAEHIDSIQYPGEVESERYSLLVLRAVNVMPESGLDSLDRILIDRIRRGNLDGTIPFELVDSAESLALLDSPEHLKQIIKRSIKTTAESRSGPRRQINQLMRYVEKESSPAGHKKIIEDALDSLYINEQELAIVGAVFPAFAKRRGVTLASLGEDSEIEVGKSTWESLSLKERTVIEQDVRVNILADQSYGVIADIQGVDRSTAATHYGAAVGSGIAQVAYVGRALDGGSYSPWMQLGLGVLGAVVGSAADRPAVQQYQHRYAVKLADGEIRSFDQTNDDPFHHPAGTCVSVPGLTPLSQKICQQTPESIRARVGLRPIPGTMKSRPIKRAL